VQLVETGGAHPLSREPITESMIMRKDECHFDSKKESFVASDAYFFLLVCFYINSLL
ncbi:T3SS effector NleG family protein, partial [Escherichia coli]|uniref:T3SS effector NleG family protein n=1 Tax=Escherichia coli TaxID=562 RepID=UPI0010AC880D